MVYGGDDPSARCKVSLGLCESMREIHGLGLLFIYFDVYVYFLSRKKELINLIMLVENSNLDNLYNKAMLCGSLVTTAWRVLRLRMEGTASRYGGYLRIY
jgi:hypothetical protein